MKRNKKQTGATLIVSLIMLVVLTLLVVAAIRSGNTNLRIVGNMQIATEADQAGMQEIERVLSTADFTKVTASSNAITIGQASYQVSIPVPTCTNTVPIYSGSGSTDPAYQLTPGDVNDDLCIQGMDNDPVFDSTGKQIPQATKCNVQQWEIQASVANTSSGESITHVQGIGKRTYVPTVCP